MRPLKSDPTHQSQAKLKTLLIVGNFTLHPPPLYFNPYILCELSILPSYTPTRWTHFRFANSQFYCASSTQPPTHAPFFLTFCFRYEANTYSPSSIFPSNSPNTMKEALIVCSSSNSFFSELQFISQNWIGTPNAFGQQIPYLVIFMILVLSVFGWLPAIPWTMDNLANFL